VRPLTLGIFGGGRLGGAIAEVARSAGAIEVLWVAGRDTTPFETVDVAIDASTASAVDDHLAWCLERGSAFLIGTTGWQGEGLGERVAGRIGVVVAPNFSLGVALYASLTRFLARYAALSPDRDPYVVEHHHARKLDAPSGTARLLAREILAACPRKTEWVIPARGERVEAHQLCVSSVRAGHTYSSHVVGIDSPGEVLELHHAARSARPYAEGALAAARWIAGRKGVHTMGDVAAEILRPVLSPEPGGASS
jgi:4-hydroxy-tetrahydrodipicolinate reductase